jgi:hypothetical protein
MGTFSIWHWLIVLVVIGVPIWLLVRYSRQRRNGQLTNAQLTGIGGWLALLAFGLCVSFLRNVLRFAKEFEGYSDAWMVPAARVPLVVAISAIVVYLAVHLWTIIALFQKRKYFRRLFLGYWIVSSLAALALLPMLTVPGVTFDMLLPPEEIVTQIGSTIGIGIWVWYTRVSVRVKNTFVT